MLNFPKDNSPKERKMREEHERLENKKRDDFQEKIHIDMQKEFNIPVVSKLPLNIFLISQKCSKYSKTEYGLIGTVGEAACGPLAVEYALRLMGYSIDFKDILDECVLKEYREYVYDDNDNIIDGSGTKCSLFSNLAIECTNLNELLRYIKKGYPITLLIQNCVLHDDEKRKGNHFITLIGIDEDGNALIMDGNKIKDENNPKDAFREIPFKKVLVGLRGAWAWNGERVKTYLK